MQTYLEMRNELISRLGVATNSTKFPSSRIQTLIKDAHLWATALYPFRELTLQTNLATTGISSTVMPGASEHSYPAAYRSNSIWMIFIGTNEYRKRNFDDLLRYALNNPASIKRRYADLGRKFYMFATPANGQTMKLYGQQQATQLSGDGDKTIFSDANDDGNEAIVLKAEAVAKQKPDKEQQAVILLTKVFSDQKDKGQFDVPMAKPFLDVPDFFGGGRSSVMPNWQNQEDNNSQDDF